MEQNTTQPEPTQQSSGPQDVENNHSSQLVEYEKIEGTPFTLVKQNEEWFMVIANNIITEPTKTKVEQIQKLETEKWLITMHLIIICMDKYYELKENKESL